MVNALANILENFPGEPNQTRCFLHILNLVAKTIIKQFDVPKKKTGEGTKDVDFSVLEALADGIELEEHATQLADEEIEVDNEEGWIDKTSLLSDEERDRLNNDILPIRQVIVKASPGSVSRRRRTQLLQLCKLAYKIVNSSTLLLPAWRMLLEQLKMADRLMPCNVRTRWNSTFAMLEFAVCYRKLLDLLSGERENGLRDFEMSEAEWKLASQLRDVLKVWSCTVFVTRQLTRHAGRFSKMRPRFSRGARQISQR